MNEDNLKRLKQNLQTLGSVQPAAWILIAQWLNFMIIRKGESFPRNLGTIAWLSSGILKEYNSFSRKKPSIINFLTPNNSLITRKLNARHYLKAVIDCEIYYLDFDKLIQLGMKFPELKAIYFSLCAQYDEGQEYKTLVLEERLAVRKIELLISRYKFQLNFISKKDLSNYVNLNYDHFCMLYSKLL